MQGPGPKSPYDLPVTAANIKDPYYYKKYETSKRALGKVFLEQKGAEMKARNSVYQGPRDENVFSTGREGRGSC